MCFETYSKLPQWLQQTPPPPPKDCHFQAPQRMPLRVWASQNIFAKIFQKKTFSKKKKKNLYFPHPRPRSKDATWGFRNKNSGNPWGGEEFAVCHTYDFKLKGGHVLRGRYFELPHPFRDLALKWLKYFPIGRILGLEKYVLFQH